MSDTVINAEQVSKRYLLRHQQPERYVAMRDVVTDTVRNLGRRLFRRDGSRHAPYAGQEEFYALKDISFDVERGDRVGIIGRNGAGKSTLLKILSRITHPSAGRVTIKGRVACLLEVGTGFHQELTGRENIFLSGAILGMRKDEIKKNFDAIVAFAEIEKFLDTPVKRYSSGMFVRLAFAVAAHLEAEILIVDEVLAVGDAEFQKKCMGKMSEVSAHGRTVLFVSHHMGAVSRLCEKGLLLTSGEGRFFKDISACIGEYLRESTPTDNTVSLHEIRRACAGLRGGARFMSAQMAPDVSQSPWKIPFPLSPELKFLIEVHRSVPNLELGIALYSQSGVEIASSLSSDSVSIPNLEPGVYEFTAVYRDPLLVPGRYSIGLGLRSDLGFEDYIVDAVAFEVLPTKESGAAKTHTRKGPVIPRVDYRMRREWLVDDECRAAALPVGTS